MQLSRIPDTQEHIFVRKNYVYLSASPNISDKEVDAGGVLCFLRCLNALMKHEVRAP